eukprot:TRINITY_DN2553_c0_g1_i1.p1 TRINITY_DN2553_c0_g1~~TRINITY_DN2553_c0_g1_i1.p1  ORF type:complete len:187 (-),score=42.92 TRINITY_DN2553_c0_g1_i1:26-586(-)
MQDDCGGLLWNAELAQTERVITACQFQKERAFLLPQLATLIPGSAEAREMAQTLEWYAQRVQECDVDVGALVDTVAIDATMKEAQRTQTRIYDEQRTKYGVKDTSPSQPLSVPYGPEEQFLPRKDTIPYGPPEAFRSSGSAPDTKTVNPSRSDEPEQQQQQQPQQEQQPGRRAVKYGCVLSHKAEL